MLNQVKTHLLKKATGQPERMSLHQNWVKQNWRVAARLTVLW